MPLSMQSRQIMDLLASLPLPPWDELDARRYRALQYAQVPPPVLDPALPSTDRTVPGPAGAPDVRVRVYGGVGASPRPGVVFLHGGGFVGGGLDSHDGLCRDIALATGAVVVSVDYRLAPEAKFPAAVEDCWAALDHIAAHAAAFGIDPRRLAVAGDSAGGGLAAVCALRARDRGGPALRHQLLIYPVTDLGLATPSYAELGEGHFLTTDMMRWFRTQYLRSDADLQDPEASPLRAASLVGTAPATVVVARYDPLRDEGVAYARRLTQAGVPMTLQEIAGGFHGFLSLSSLLPEAAAALADAMSALKAALQ